MKKQKVLLSAIKPTGTPTLGNYIGAMKNISKLQEEYKDDLFIFFVADLHALTTPQDPKELKQNIYDVAALYLACGLKEENLILFIQSEVVEHVQLSLILEGITYMGELERMTQYKDKKQKQVQGVSSALFTYPVLMAADILLYDTDYVPVGEDQTQHLELTRDIANRFNNRFGETFIVPETMVVKTGARIKDLQDPSKKMDKSVKEAKGSIFLLEPINSVKKKIMSAVTDNLGQVKYNEKKQPGIANLMTIYSSLTSLSFKEIENKYKGKGYGEFKKDLAEIVANEIEGIQKKYNEIIKSEKFKNILEQGKINASKLASKKINKVYKKVGVK